MGCANTTAGLCPFVCVSRLRSKDGVVRQINFLLNQSEILRAAGKRRVQQATGRRCFVETVIGQKYDEECE